MQSDRERLTEFKELLGELKEERAEYQLHWQEICEWILPRSGKYLYSDTEDPKTRGGKKNQRIITGIAKRCIQNFAAGVQSGLSSPAQKWLALEHPVEEVNEDIEVKEWLSTATNSILSILKESRFYASAETVYKHLAAFGTAGIIMEECHIPRKNKKTQLARFTIMEPGEYYIGEDENKDIDTLMRRFSMTAYQVAKKFGKEKLPRKVKEALDRKSTEERFTVIHLILPNNEYRAGSILPENMEYASFYYVEGVEETEKNIFLRGGEGDRQGFSEKPFAVVRWEFDSDVAYGSSIGMDALPDIKQLQKMSLKKLKQIDLYLNPPVNLPASMKNSADFAGTNPNDRNYVPENGSGEYSVQPTMQVSGDINPLILEIQNKSEEIKEWFLNNIFFAVLEQDKQMTAYEVAQRMAARLSIIGPATERMQYEFLSPIIDFVYGIAERTGILPDPPEQLDNILLSTVYNGVLAQAQKMSEITTIEQAVTFLGSLAATYPEIVDHIDFDELALHYCSIIKMPPKVLRSYEELHRIRDERMKKENEAAGLAQLQQAAEGAKTVSEIDTESNNAMTQLLGGLTG